MRIPMPRIAKEQRVGALVIAAFVAALALTATLQFHWTGQLSEAQHSTMKTALANSVRQFEREFAHELAHLLSVFGPSPIAAAGVQWDRYLERYDEWYGSSDYAPLVSRVLFCFTPPGGAPSLHELLPAERRFAAADWQESQQSIKRRIESWIERSRGSGTREGRQFVGKFFLQEKVFALPLHSIVRPNPGESEPERSARVDRLLIEIDPVYLAERMIPEMAARYFSGPDGEELYRIAIVEQSSADFEQGSASFLYRSHDSIDKEWLATSDIRFPLFGARFGGPRSRKGPPPPPPPPYGRGGGDFLNVSGGFSPPREELGGREGASSERSGRGAPAVGRPAMFLGRAAVSLTGRGRNSRWIVAAKHMAGSLDEAVRLQRRRNLALGSGILLILGAAMTMAVVSSRRSRRLANIQMEFVAGVSHELRTPLTVIRAAGDNLASGLVGSGEQVMEYGRMIRDQGRRLSQTVEQTLRFGALQSGRIKFKIESVDAAQVIAETLAEARPAIDQAGFELRQAVEGNLPPVRADRGALRRSLGNLIANAVKYGAAGRRIEVEAAAAEVNGAWEVQIRVRDRGIGISPQELKNIFEPFYRGAAASEAQIEGSGLGLKLACDMTRGMGGDLTVESEVGRGSTFTIHLPLAEPATKDPATKDNEQRKNTSG